MASFWQFWRFEGGAYPTSREVKAMVVALEGRHGALAADIAEFFAVAHGLKGDARRSSAWAGVAEMARLRERGRILKHRS